MKENQILNDNNVNLNNELKNIKKTNERPLSSFSGGVRSKYLNRLKKK